MKVASKLENPRYSYKVLFSPIYEFNELIAHRYRFECTNQNKCGKQSPAFLSASLYKIENLNLIQDFMSVSHELPVYIVHKH